MFNSEIVDILNVLPSVNSGVMKGMSDLANSINGPSAALNVGEGVTGILAKQTDPVVFEEMLFGYASPSDDMNVGVLFVILCQCGHVLRPRSLSFSPLVHVCVVAFVQHRPVLQFPKHKVIPRIINRFTLSKSFPSLESLNRHCVFYFYFDHTLVFFPADFGR